MRDDGYVTRHTGCGGLVEWVDVTNIDEAWICQKCGQEVDGEDMTVEKVGDR